MVSFTIKKVLDSHSAVIYQVNDKRFNTKGKEWERAEEITVKIEIASNMLDHFLNIEILKLYKKSICHLY